MKYAFHACGHPNILGSHKTTIEFTKDPELSLKGNCIVGVKSDFKLEKMKEFMKNSAGKKISIRIEAIGNGKKINEEITAEINPGFNSDKEMVIRKTGFISERTFAILADKAACNIGRRMTEQLKKTDCAINVTLHL